MRWKVWNLITLLFLKIMQGKNHYLLQLHLNAARVNIQIPKLCLAKKVCQLLEDESQKHKIWLIKYPLNSFEI